MDASALPAVRCHNSCLLVPPSPGGATAPQAPASDSEESSSLRQSLQLKPLKAPSCIFSVADALALSLDRHAGILAVTPREEKRQQCLAGHLTRTRNTGATEASNWPQRNGSEDFDSGTRRGTAMLYSS